jgi:hypothetical protein
MSSAKSLVDHVPGDRSGFEDVGNRPGLHRRVESAHRPVGGEAELKAALLDHLDHLALAAQLVVGEEPHGDLAVGLELDVFLEAHKRLILGGIAFGHSDPELDLHRIRFGCPDDKGCRHHGSRKERIVRGHGILLQSDGSGARSLDACCRMVPL